MWEVEGGRGPYMQYLGKIAITRWNDLKQQMLASSHQAYRPLALFGGSNG
ncbi:uncharacterized protein PHALS_02387 [Plasmopara halstedii]|uniref:Uncharacterized protein n=1 Tax=Plasmopara halstedii TaxID=4781 RepID=A0A0P1AXV2_PLAHL|nr:uncharacterized protein PHALS_02387 [Plasmopara halstedii]CEG46065.1 hypothetical protein PHALS_02387 [Plasmopara halstedii]|eukprot:XP_024582434.1 hypothetical protein PHALS_02387 [Plasmopara halstedii]